MSTELDARIAALKVAFPDDERLRNAALMAMGCTDQLPVMNETFRKLIVFRVPTDPAETLDWETAVHLALSDVLQWVTRLELALHDLRSSLFYRYQNRVSALAPPTQQEIARAEEEAVREQTRLAAKKETEARPPKQPKPDGPPAPAPTKRIAALFGDIR